jgi:FixJ family two-component response regulator
VATPRVITIIDDDASVREATARLVRSLGHRTAVFCSAEEFLQSDCVRESACLITDLQLSGMSGAGLQDRLIADGYRTPMIFMTAYFDEKIRAQVMRAGAFGFLSKPFADESLIESLDKALEDSNSGGP